MKFLRVGKKGHEIVAALSKDNKIRDLSSFIKDLNPETINLNLLDELKKIDLQDLPIINSSERVGSCISRPGDFLAIGLNYKAHAEGTNSKLPAEPILFNKSTGCLQGPNDPIIKPINSMKLDYEAEVGMIVGKKGKYIKEENAHEYILGYCIVNDVSERSWQKERGGQWIKGKSVAGNCGPLLVTKDEINNINDINLILDVNGERRQTGNTSRMIFNFNFLISHISQFMVLYPGTIITTGTPAGTAMEMKEPKFLSEKDKIHIKIDHLGEQNHIVVGE
jgi:2-keto-4-pentenoate hydratase/2-oxohepta-3-ene-1,7-dioic acid hydratase in catechol pathway